MHGVFIKLMNITFITVKLYMKVTQACVDYVVEGVTNLTDTILDICKTKLSHVLDEGGADIDDLCLDEVFDGCRHPFKNLQTAYQQTQFIKNTLSYVV